MREGIPTKTSCLATQLVSCTICSVAPCSRRGLKPTFLRHSWKCGRYSELRLWHGWLHIHINPTKLQAPLHPKWTCSTSPCVSVCPTRQPWYEKNLITFHYVWVQNAICSVFMRYFNWSPGLKTCYIFRNWHIAFTLTLPPKTKGTLSSMDNVLSL